MIILAPKRTFVISGIQINVYHANINEGLPKHEHTYKHATACHAGSILITKSNGQWTLDKNSQPVILKENEWHEIEAMQDGTIFENIFEEGKY